MSDGVKSLGFRDKAVLAAEGLARSKHPETPDAYEGAINSQDELDAFYKTALDVVLEGMIAGNDPQAANLRAELARVVADAHSKPANPLFKPVEFERTANLYWAKLLEVAEKEKRSKLVHDKDLFKRLGIDERQVRVLQYHPERSSNPWSDFVMHKYDVEIDGVEQTVSFFEDGDGDTIEIDSRTDNWWMSTYKTDSIRRPMEGAECDHIWSGFRKISLADIMDMSAFRLYQVRDGEALKKAMDSLVQEAPVRSTDADLQKLIELASEIKNLDFARMPYDSIVERAGSIARRMVRTYFSLKSRKHEYAAKLDHNLRRFVYQNPHLASGALDDVQNLEELELFKMPYCLGRRKEVEKKREELLRRETSTRFAKMKGFDRFSPEHKKALEKILAANKLPEKHWERFVAEFGRVPKKYAENYADDFIGRYRDDDEDRSFESLMYYARALEGLKRDGDFEAFASYFDNKFMNIGRPTTELIHASRLIRNLSFENYESRSVGLVLCSVYNAGELRKGLNQIRRMTKKGVPENKITELLGSNPPSTPQSLFIKLEIIERLYDTYRDDVDMFIRRLWNWNADKLDFAKLNRLTGPQRARLIRYMDSHGDNYPATLLNFLADTAIKIKTDDEWNFVTTFRLEDPSPAIPKEELMSGNANIASRYPNVWPALENSRAQSANFAATDNNLRLLGTFMQRGIPEDKIIELLKYLPRITLDIQRRTIETLSTDENVAEIFAAVAGSEETFTKIGNSEPYLKALAGNPRPEEIPLLATVFAEAEKTYFNLETPILGRVGNLPRFLIETHSKFKEFGVSSSFEKIVKREEAAGANPSETVYLARFYVDRKVRPDNFKDPESAGKMIADFEAFLLRIKKAGYDINTDPDQERTKAILEPERTLAQMNDEYTHLAFIINVLMDSSPEYSRENLVKWALDRLNDDNLIIRMKAAKLLIGLGTSVQTLTPDVIRNIAGLAVDGRVFKGKLYDKITDDLIAVTKRENTPELPLGLFYSMLINCKSDIAAELDKMIARYSKIEDQPVYEGRLIALAYNTHDYSHSFLSGSDAFNPEPHIQLAGLQNLNVAVYRHGQNGENVESMMSALETAEGDVTVVIGGHGQEGSISFGDENFKMDELFERLAGRLARQKEGKQWQTKLIFFSCYSDKNIELLLEKWAMDERTRGKPSVMLSSSGNNSPSLKMAADGWLMKARRCKETGCKLTWKEFYRDIESRSFIMYTNYGSNSNMTLYIDGEIFG